MIKNKQVKKCKHLRCRTDKTRCRIPCPKCKKNTGFSKLYRSPENVWRHLFQVHKRDRNEYPSVSFTIDVLEKISIALQNKIPIETIEEVRKLKMVIR